MKKAVNINKDNIDTPKKEVGFYEAKNVSKIGFKWLSPILLIFLIGIITSGTLYYLSNKDIAPKIEETETLISPEVTDNILEKVIDKNKYKLTILNGSGIAREADKMKVYLEEKGYVIEKTGNAESFDYLKTTISSNNEIEEEFLDQLISDLKEDYSVDEEIINKEQVEEVILIVGSQRI